LFGLTGENMTMRMRMAAFRNILRQDVSYFDDARHSTGKICTRLATDAPNIRAVGASVCIQSVRIKPHSFVILRKFPYGLKPKVPDACHA
jgi:ABC-type multidrug transport system fused ATPase/permease subunit